MRFRGPLADSYPAAVALVLLALCPYLALTTALGPVAMQVQRSLGLGHTAMQVSTAMANAAYSFGTVLAVQLTTRLPARRVLLGASGTFVVSSLLAAWAPTPGAYVAGHVAQGLATGVMLIAAVPPLVTGYGARELRTTGFTMNLGIFGAVALGPVVGGAFAAWQAWHALFWVVAALGVAALAMALITYEDAEPQDPETPVDLVALVLAAGGCAATFFGVAQLVSHPFVSAVVLAPALGGIALLVVMLVYEYRHHDPLIPAERLATTVPVAGVIVAMAAGAAAIALIELAEQTLRQKGVAPGHAALLFLPLFGGAIAAAAAFGAVIRTRWNPLLALAGILGVAVGAVVMTGMANGSQALIAVGIGVAGLGVGASVSPALFVAGFSRPSPILPRIFSVVELLRGVSAFVVAPVLLHMALTVGGPATGTRGAVWIAFGVAVLGGAVAAALWLAGGARLEDPRLDEWLEREGQALDTPRLLARLRRR